MFFHYLIIILCSSSSAIYIIYNCQQKIFYFNGKKYNIVDK